MDQKSINDNNKVARLSSDQNDVKMPKTVTVRDASLSDDVTINDDKVMLTNPHFLHIMIQPDLLKTILGMILSHPDPNNRRDFQLMQSCRDIPRVCKAFHAATRHLMNAQVNITTDVALPGVTSMNLASIKARVMQLELDTIRNNFIIDIQKTWGDKQEQMSTIYERFGGNEIGFSKLVAKEYRKLLVVKCVEMMVVAAADDDDDDDDHGAHKKNVTIEADDDVVRDGTNIKNTITSTPIIMWTEKCMPTVLVDKFWHAHMVAPKKYASDCNFLIGEIIDHDAGYISPQSVVGSDYESKKSFLFAFEKQFPLKDYYFRGRLFTRTTRSVDKLWGSDLDVDILAEMMAPSVCG